MISKEVFLGKFKERFESITKEKLKLDVKIGSMSRTRGYFAHSSDGEALFFKFSNDLLDERFCFDDVVKIMEHEIIHYIVLKKYGHNVKPHGVEFEKTCKEYNVEFFIYSSFEYNPNSKFPKLICTKCNRILKGFSTIKQGKKFLRDNQKYNITSQCCKALCELKN